MTLTERQEKFITDGTTKFNGKFDYSTVHYKNNSTKVTIKCPIHGKFLQRPGNHLNSKEGCYQCGKDRAGANHRLTHIEFLKRCREVHGDRYDYPEEYTGAFIPLTVKCRIHGEFTQVPNDHTYHGTGCTQCTAINRMTKGETDILNILDSHGVEAFPQQTFYGLLADDEKSPLRYDFFLPTLNILIEFDGPHHTAPVTYKGCTRAQAINTHRKTLIYDKLKTDYANKNGIRLMRIPYTRSRKQILQHLTPLLPLVDESPPDCL